MMKMTKTVPLVRLRRALAERIRFTVQVYRKCVSDNPADIIHWKYTAHYKLSALFDLARFGGFITPKMYEALGNWKRKEFA